ncbi:MAG TPA: hypothetical protein VF171_07570, partial [Trueperaceae bacterium]
WRLSDLLAALVYLAVSLTLVELLDLNMWLAVAAGYLPCTLMLARLERGSLWNPVLLDVRAAEYREA